MGKIVFMKFPTKEKASKFAAEVILEVFANLDEWQNMVLGTATGQSPVLTYQEFAKLIQESCWYNDYKSHLIFRQLDNYISPGAAACNLPEYSYELELENSIWKVPNGGTFIPKEYAKDPEAEAKRYAEIIEKTNAGSSYTLQILGIGDEDGHIAFNMPGDSFDSTVHVVELNEETIRANADKFFGGDTSKVPRKAITTGIGDILKSDGIILEAFGKKKADTIWKSFFSDPTTDIPATALQTFEGSLLVLLDEESASTLLEKQGEAVFTVCDNDADAREEFIKALFLGDFLEE